MPRRLLFDSTMKFHHALTDAKLLENFNKGVVEPIGGTADDLGKIARADSEKYAKLVKELNIKSSGL